MRRTAIKIRELQAADLPRLAATDGGAAWSGGDAKKWQRYLAEHRDGTRLVLVAVSPSAVLGYCTLLWRTPYLHFRRAGIPEIKDLVVAEKARRHGIGARLLRVLERRAREGGYKQIGLAVGLYADYGAAQRLYVRRGYVPDGHGITYGHRTVPWGKKARVDDSLALWLVKRLQS